MVLMTSGSTLKMITDSYHNFDNTANANRLNYASKS